MQWQQTKHNEWVTVAVVPHTGCQGSVYQRITYLKITRRQSYQVEAESLGMIAWEVIGEKIKTLELAKQHAENWTEKGRIRQRET